MRCLAIPSILLWPLLLCLPGCPPRPGADPGQIRHALAPLPPMQAGEAPPGPPASTRYIAPLLLGGNPNDPRPVVAVVTMEPGGVLIRSQPGSTEISVPDSTFRTASLPPKSYVVDPPELAWKRSPGSVTRVVVASPGSGYTIGNPSLAPADHVLVLQRGTDVSVPVELPSGGPGDEYELTITAAQRGNFRQAEQAVEGFLGDKATTGTFTPEGIAFRPYTFRLKVAPDPEGTTTVPLRLKGHVAAVDATALISSVSLRRLDSSSEYHRIRPPVPPRTSTLTLDLSIPADVPPGSRIVFTIHRLDPQTGVLTPEYAGGAFTHPMRVGELSSEAKVLPHYTGLTPPGGWVQAAGAGAE